jgi:uncharacterized protein with HEPN domain
MLEFLTEVVSHTPADWPAFASNKLVQSHLARHIQIVGEAAARLSKPFQDSHADVPWRSIAGMRHVIVHAYPEIDWNEVYATAVRDVPVLRQQIESILRELPTDGD